MTDAERRAALEAIAAEVRDCTRCRLHVGRTRSVPGEGNPDTEVVFVGEGPGFNEDRQGRPFVGRAGDLLVKLLGSIGWRREDVFITNIVKCRPPDNRDPEPDEIAACAPYLRRQLEVLDPALVVTLGRHSMGRFMPGARISQAHGTGARRTRRRAPATRWCSRCTTRRRRCGPRPSSARATPTSATIPARPAATRGPARARPCEHRRPGAHRTTPRRRPQPTDDRPPVVAAPPPEPATATADTDQLTLF